MLNLLNNIPNEHEANSRGISNGVDLGFCFMRLLASGIVVHKFSENEIIEKENIKEMFAVMKVFHGVTGKMHPTLNLVPESLNLTKEAREFGIKKEVNQYTSASAIVLSSLAHRILGNFIMKVQKPAMPFKLFTSEEVASEWLLSYTEE
jgi:hypothetical protein